MEILLQGLTKRFGRNKALDGFDLAISPGSVVAFVGENGAGKSTLLRILAGIDVPDDGFVFYNHVIFDRENMDLRKRLGFIPDMPLLLYDQTVARNISTFAALYGKTLENRETSFSEWIENSGCAPLMKRKACEALARSDLEGRSRVCRGDRARALAGGRTFRLGNG